MIADIVPLPGVRRLPPARMGISLEFSVEDVMAAFPELDEAEARGVLARFCQLTEDALGKDRVATLRDARDLLL